MQGPNFVPCIEKGEEEREREREREKERERERKEERKAGREGREGEERNIEICNAKKAREPDRHAW
jgi:hypothetical protein